MPIYRKYRLIIFIVAISIISGGSFWFFTKFYPAQTGEWDNNKSDNFSDEKKLNFGFRGNQFWISVDYPGQQDICLNINLKNTSSDIQQFSASVSQSPRAVSYPLAGEINSLFQEQSPSVVTENINQDKPYLLYHLSENISREGKDLFFVGAGEKFLIPTKNIFTAYYPNLDLPLPSDNNLDLTYSNKLINFPEGAILSDGKGVFIMSGNKLNLVRSPEIFEALGYKWEEIRQMSKVDLTFNPYLSGNLIDFDAAHPSGTILKNENELFLVWNEKRYTLSEEDKSKYFPGAPQVTVGKRELNPVCQTTDNQKINCCIKNFDPRLNPPLNYPFANTLSWDFGQLAYQDTISKISWQAKVKVNKENTLHRLRSLANFVLYSLGILK